MTRVIQHREYNKIILVDASKPVDLRDLQNATHRLELKIVAGKIGELGFS